MDINRTLSIQENDQSYLSEGATLSFYPSSTQQIDKKLTASSSSMYETGDVTFQSIRTKTLR